MLNVVGSDLKSQYAIMIPTPGMPTCLAGMTEFDLWFISKKLSLH
jgi:hypothetical protein